LFALDAREVEVLRIDDVRDRVRRVGRERANLVVVRLREEELAHVADVARGAVGVAVAPGLSADVHLHVHVLRPALVPARVERRHDGYALRVRHLHTAEVGGRRREGRLARRILARRARVPDVHCGAGDRRAGARIEHGHREDELRARQAFADVRAQEAEIAPRRRVGQLRGQRTVRDLGACAARSACAARAGDFGAAVAAAREEVREGRGGEGRADGFHRLTAGDGRKDARHPALISRAWWARTPRGSIAVGRLAWGAVRHPGRVFSSAARRYLALRSKPADARALRFDAMARKPVLLLPALALSLGAAVMASCDHTPASPSARSDAGTIAFQADPPRVYVAKVKNLLVGLPPTDDEIRKVTADPKQLASLIDGWMAMPEYTQKMQRFFELAFQQTQITVASFVDMMPPYGMEGMAMPRLVENAEESFARTVLALIAEGRPLSEAMTTKRYMMTPPLMELYALL